MPHPPWHNQSRLCGDRPTWRSIVVSNAPLGLAIEHPDDLKLNISVQSLTTVGVFMRHRPTLVEQSQLLGKRLAWPGAIRIRRHLFEMITTRLAEQICRARSLRRHAAAGDKFPFGRTYHWRRPGRNGRLSHARSLGVQRDPTILLFFHLLNNLFGPLHGRQAPIRIARLGFPKL